MLSKIGHLCSLNNLTSCQIIFCFSNATCSLITSKPHCEGINHLPLDSGIAAPLAAFHCSHTACGAASTSDVLRIVRRYPRGAGVVLVPRPRPCLQGDSNHRSPVVIRGWSSPDIDTKAGLLCHRRSVTNDFGKAVGPLVIRSV